MVNHFVNSPTKKHLENMYCIPRYLKESLAKDYTSRKHQTGMSICTQLLIGLVSRQIEDQLRVIALSYRNLTTWLSKKQFVVARSSSKLNLEQCLMALVKNDTKVSNLV